MDLSISSPNVLLGGRFSITVQFEPNSTATYLNSFRCGYETSSASFRQFVEYDVFTYSLQLINAGFPTSYMGRMTIANKTTMVISNVKFEDEGTRYSCEMKYFDPVGRISKFFSSMKQTIASVYGK